MKTVPERLAALRQAMREQQIDLWLQPSADPHLSEYLPERWQGRAWLSGFTGSAGTLLVTADRAQLWTDSRYWEQAEQQLHGSGIELAKITSDANYLNGIVQLLPEQGGTVAVAADSLSMRTDIELRVMLYEQNTLKTDVDLLDAVWHNRPALPAQAVYPHHADFVCQSAADKLRQLRLAMQQCGADYHLISSLDDIAWLTNLRGNDVSYNPVFLAHFLLSAEHATLFACESAFDARVRQLLDAAGIVLQPYEAVGTALAQLPSGSLLLDGSKTAVSTIQKLAPTIDNVIDQSNPSVMLKACKSDAELAHIRATMQQDGAALCGFFAELENKLSEEQVLTEYDIDIMLLAHRACLPHFVSPSFGTIAGFRANGALPHYSATPETAATLTGNGLLLIDSGGQYHGGTTDITRVVPIGTPSVAEKRDFTLVLKAHIALATAVFPADIAAPVLDAICRRPLWQAHCDYGHGTGHGVGYFLNVHEPPQSIAYKGAISEQNRLKPGMVTSNEPALYRSGKWGIRIENLIAVRALEQPQETEFGVFYCFETLTLCPIDTRLIDKTLLNQDEINWLNRYHQTVREQLLPHTEAAARQWLLARTEPI